MALLRVTGHRHVTIHSLQWTDILFFLNLHFQIIVHSWKQESVVRSLYIHKRHNLVQAENDYKYVSAEFVVLSPAQNNLIRLSRSSCAKFSLSLLHFFAASSCAWYIPSLNHGQITEKAFNASTQSHASTRFSFAQGSCVRVFNVLENTGHPADHTEGRSGVSRTRHQSDFSLLDGERGSFRTQVGVCCCV